MVAQIISSFAGCYCSAAAVAYKGLGYESGDFGLGIIQQGIGFEVICRVLEHHIFFKIYILRFCIISAFTAGDDCFAINHFSAIRIIADPGLSDHSAVLLWSGILFIRKHDIFLKDDVFLVHIISHVLGVDIRRI